MRGATIAALALSLGRCPPVRLANEPAVHADAVADTLLAMRSLHSTRSEPLGAAPGATPHPQAWQLISAAEEQLAAEPEPETEVLSALYARAATDGELLDDGVATLIETLQPDEGSVFADLGSGRGGALLRVAAALPLRGCFGVELIASKHAAAEALRAAVEDQLRSPVTLWKGDLIEVEAATKEREGLRELTHAYSCSVCFDDFLLRRMAEALANRDAFPRFQALVSMRMLPAQPHLVRLGSVPLYCTWNAAARGHVYVAADLLERPVADRPVAILERFLCREGTCTLPASLQWARASGSRLSLPR